MTHLSVAALRAAIDHVEVALSPDPIAGRFLDLAPHPRGHLRAWLRRKAAALAWLILQPGRAAEPRRARRRPGP